MISNPMLLRKCFQNIGKGGMVMKVQLALVSIRINLLQPFQSFNFNFYVPVVVTLRNQAHVMCCCVNEQGVIRNQFGIKQCFRSIDINNGEWCPGFWGHSFTIFFICKICLVNSCVSSVNKKNREWSLIQLSNYLRDNYLQCYAEQCLI